MKANCPVLNKCKEASGIDCQGRDYGNCDFYKRLLHDKRKSG